MNEHDRDYQFMGFEIYAIFVFQFMGFEILFGSQENEGKTRKIEASWRNKAWLSPLREKDKTEKEIKKKKTVNNFIIHLLRCLF